MTKLRQKQQQILMFARLKYALASVQVSIFLDSALPHISLNSLSTLTYIVLNISPFPVSHFPYFLQPPYLFLDVLIVKEE